jgi:hypothetical protein
MAAAAAALAIGCAAGCAVGSVEGEYDVPEGGGSPGDGDGGTSGDGHQHMGMPEAGGVDAEDDGSEGGNDGGSDAQNDGSGDGGGIACTSPNTCQSATSLGTMSGDTSGSDLSSQGDTAEWLVADVTENDSSPLAVPMKLKVTLTSPPGMNFDLYAYLGSTVSAIECTTVKASSMNGVGQTDTVSLEWGETGVLANGVDDSRHVSVEVRYVSGTCDPSSKWTLDLHGH